mgnify:CR=1 FL=1
MDRHTKTTYKYDPLEQHLTFTRIFALAVLWFYWILTTNDALEIILFLGLVIFTMFRYFYPKKAAVILAAGLFTGVMVFLQPHFAVVFAIPLFEGVLLKKLRYLLPGGILAFIRWEPSLGGVMVILMAGIIGYLFRITFRERDYYRDESDWERRKRYETENTNSELLSMREEILHMTELSERNRIAQRLHDDVGHELTGAVLALQALSSMLEEYDLTPQELVMYHQMEERVKKSAKSLRDTVHKMKPSLPLGIDALQEIIHDFDQLPLTFRLYGNPESVPVYYWVFLRRALKEGLTNVMRHAEAKAILLQLDITPRIIRFNLENDGLKTEETPAGFRRNGKKTFIEGIGLRSLRQRTMAYGGSFSAARIPAEDRFRLVIILPLREEAHHEGAHSGVDRR